MYKWIMRKKCKCNNLMFIRKQMFGMISVSMIIGMVLVLFFSCSEGNEYNHDPNYVPGQIYYCPMHPEVQQDHPGKCPRPECHGMNLVLKKSNDNFLGAVLRPVSSNVLSKINLINPRFNTLPVYVEALGY